MVSKKVKKSKSKDDESSIVNSKSMTKKENSTHDESLDIPEGSLPIIKVITENAVKIVVEKLKPDLQNAVDNRFDEIKKIVTSEVQDIRTTIENKLPTQPLEQSQVSDKVAHSPDNQVRGLENNSMRNPPKSSSNIEALLPTLMQLLPSLLNKPAESTPQNNMPQMLVELMMKKFVNDMGRSDTQNQAVTDYLLKQMLKRDPNILKGLADNELTKSSTPNESNQDHF
jgi:hypothetical protein